MLPNSRSQKYTPMFSSESFTILTFTFRFLIHIELIHIGKYSFFHWFSWYQCQKSIDDECNSLFLDSEFYSTDPICLSSIQYYWLLELCNKFLNRKVWVLQLCFLLHGCFGYCGSLKFPCFRITEKVLQHK